MMECTTPQPGDRALTILQPWASLCITPDPAGSGFPVKPVENRGWPVPVTLWGDRGELTEDMGDGIQLHRHFRLWIHAAARDTDNDPSIPRCAWDALGEVIGGAAPPRGALLGSVKVWGCHPWEDCLSGTAPSGAGMCSPWAEPDVYHWQLTDPQPLPEPVPMRGRQRLWRIPEEVTA